MNFLAHSLLSPEHDHWLTGNIVADLIKKKDILLLEKHVRLGVQLHYHIDTYTDTHPVVSKANRLLHPTQGKYSPVGTDLIWDLCLAKQWETFSHLNIDDFIQGVYNHLEQASDHLETDLASKIKYLLEKRFLHHYTEPEQMRVITEKIHQRTRFKSNLHHLVDDYLQLEESFNELFAEFYVDLSGMIDDWKIRIFNESFDN